MKRIFAFSILLLSFFASLSQINMVKGEEFVSVDHASADYIIQGDSVGFYMLNSSSFQPNGNCKLYKFNSTNGKIIFTKQLNFGSSGEISLVAAHLIKNRIVLFIKVDEEKRVYLQKREFHCENGNETLSPAVFDEFEMTMETDVIRRFIVLFSPDNTKMAVLKEEFSTSRNQIMFARVFETNGFRKIWEQKLNSGSANQAPEGINDPILDNEGKLAYAFETNNETFGVFIIHESYSNNKTIMIPSGEVTLLNPVVESVGDQLICTGEVLEGKRKFKMYEEQGVKMGFFFLRLDAEKGKISVSSYDYFSPDLQSKMNYHDKSYFYKFEGIRSFPYSNKNYLHYKTFYLNGSMYVVKYHGYVWTETSFFGDETERPVQNDILIFKYSNSKFDWMRVVPCRNSLPQKTGINYIVSENLHFFYFDHPDNPDKITALKNYDPAKYRKTGKRSFTLVHTSIDETGNIQREKINTDKSWYLYPDPDKAFNHYKKSTILSTFPKKKRRFDVITVKEQP